jgi:hypothetical protein
MNWFENANLRDGGYLTAFFKNAQEAIGQPLRDSDMKSESLCIAKW